MAKADVAATTFKERKNPKVVSHIEVRPNMEGGHNVHTVHTHSYDHPDMIKKFPGPHEPISIPKGHILAHLGKEMGIKLDTEAAAGTEENVGAKEGAQL